VSTFELSSPSIGIVLIMQTLSAGPVPTHSLRETPAFGLYRRPALQRPLDA
jgi:hypothetical protein